jgi:hypothetical protein
MSGSSPDISRVVRCFFLVLDIFKLWALLYNNRDPVQDYQQNAVYESTQVANRHHDSNNDN